MDKISYLIVLFILFSSCDTIRLLNISEENDESTEEISSFLKQKKFHYDYSFEVIDSTSFLLAQPNYRLDDSSLGYSLIQLRVYDSLGNLYSGYSQCMGSFNKNKIIDKLPPPKNTYPFLNTKLKLRNELNLINIDSETKLKVIKESRKHDYTFVVYWTIWTNYFSKHVLKEVSKIKIKEPDKILVILVNTAKDKQSP